MPDFDGKSIVVTGGSLGMGRACVERFSSWRRTGADRRQ